MSLKSKHVVIANLKPNLRSVAHDDLVFGKAEGKASTRHRLMASMFASKSCCFADTIESNMMLIKKNGISTSGCVQVSCASVIAFAQMLYSFVQQGHAC